MLPLGLDSICIKEAAGEPCHLPHVCEANLLGVFELCMLRKNGNGLGHPEHRGDDVVGRVPEIPGYQVVSDAASHLNADLPQVAEGVECAV